MDSFKGLRIERSYMREGDSTNIPKYESLESEIINDAILEYLCYHQFVHTIDCFRAEAETIKIREEDNVKIGVDEHDKHKQMGNLILEAFDKGEEDTLLQLWNACTMRRECDKVGKILEFDLRIHLATFLLRSEDPDYERQPNMQQEARMASFKSYLQTGGQALAQTAEYSPFYALPFAPDPTNHPSFSHVFAKGWIDTLRGRLVDYLAQIVQPVPQPALHLLFASCHAGNEAAINARQSSSEHLETKKSREYNLLEKLHASCAEACSVITVLQSQKTPVTEDETCSLLARIAKYYTTLRTSDRSSSRNVSPDIVETRGGGQIGSEEHLPHQFKTVDNLEVDIEQPLQVLVSPKSPSRSRKPRPLSPMEMPILPDLEYSQVKVDLHDLSEMTGARPTRLLSLILQALRWRLSKTPKWGDRERVVTGICDNDMLGLYDEDQGGINLCVRLLQNPSPLVVEYTCRFLNYMAFHATGRKYLRSCPAAGDCLLNVLTEQQYLETPILQNALGTIQKLSLNRECAVRWIEKGVMEFLVRFLLHRRNRKVSMYTTDYSMALLLNLCLHQAGRDRATQHLATSLPKLLHRMIVEGKAIQYVNGIVYSISRCVAFKEQFVDPACPLKKAISKALQRSAIETTIREQMEYLLLLLNGELYEGEDEAKMPGSPSGSEADDEEEQLEPEIDDEEHEEMRIARTRQEFTNAAELVGETLACVITT